MLGLCDTIAAFYRGRLTSIAPHDGVDGRGAGARGHAPVGRRERPSMTDDRRATSPRLRRTRRSPRATPGARSASPPRGRRSRRAGGHRRGRADAQLPERRQPARDPAQRAIVGIVAVAMTPMTLSGNFVSLGIAQSAMAGDDLFLALDRERVAAGSGDPRHPAGARAGRRRCRGSSSPPGSTRSSRRWRRARHLRGGRRRDQRPGRAGRRRTRCPGATPHRRDPARGPRLRALHGGRRRLHDQDGGRPRDDPRRRQPGHRRGQRHLLPSGDDRRVRHLLDRPGDRGRADRRRLRAGDRSSR